MKAVVFEQFGQPPTVQTVADPTPGRRRRHQGRGHRPVPQRLAWLDGPRRRISRCRMCRAMNWPESWWPPASRSRAGRRATASRCRSSSAAAIATNAHSGNHQVCEHQFQPGFTAWGSFAEYVAIDYADTNLVRSARRSGFRHRRQPRLPLRHLVSRHRRPGPGEAGRMGGGAWLRRRRPVRHHDRQRHGRQRRSPST